MSTNSSHSFLADVFPGTEYIPVDLSALCGHISKVCEERRLVEGERWVNKISDLDTEYTITMEGGISSYQGWHSSRRLG
jgi:hypothetical protein